MKQIADIVDGEIIFSGRRIDDFAAVLTNLDDCDGSDLGPKWIMTLLIGEGPSARPVKIELASILSRSGYESSQSEPVFLPLVTPAGCMRIDLQLALFRDRLFAIEPPLRNAPMQEEAGLRIKRQVYAQEAEVTSLKSYVANVEAAIAYQSGPKREPIPDDAKMLVWSRDGGACTRCGSKSDLHFDHIIPVAKGGSNVPENIQLLCKPCNLRKSDKIAF